MCGLGLLTQGDICLGNHAEHIFAEIGHSPEPGWIKHGPDIALSE